MRLVVDRAPDTVAATVEAGLPSYSTELLRPAAMLARRLYDALPATATPAQRAHRLTVLGIWLSEVGDKRAALAPTEEAVAIYRRLADALPLAFTGYLRAAMSTQADVLDGLGRSYKADELRRQLDEDHPTSR